MELSLKEIQTVELEILKYFDCLCQKNNLTYFLAYGTLLGAVRHKGFIPWDDDLDVWMPRNDYEKLKKIMSEKNSDYYALIYRENTENYDLGIPRLVDTRYEYVNNIHKKKRVNMGVFVDIYPLDNYGNDVQLGKKLYKFSNRINEIYRLYINGKSYTNSFRSIFKYICHKVLNIVYGNDLSKTVDKRIVRYINKYTTDDDKFIGVPSWESYGVMQFEKELFENSTMIEFENLKVNVPIGYDVLLRRIYGNYKELPPIDKRNPHHGYRIYKKKV